MTANELRSKYIEFFKSKNHVEISGQSLIPENDPSVLFTTLLSLFRSATHHRNFRSDIMSETTQTAALLNQSIEYVRSKDLLADSQTIIESARSFAYRAINIALVQRNWLLGKRIAEEHVDEEGHAEYGKQIIQSLSDRLTEQYGNRAVYGPF